MHIGVIPDGNRRYADSHGITNYKAYRKARDTVKHVTDSLMDYSDKVDEISFYLLSEENLKRDEEELETLFDLLDNNIDDMAEHFREGDFRLNWASTEPEALPERLRDKLRDLESEFKNGKIKVNLIIAYSGKRDILEASKEISEDDSNFEESNLVDHLEIDTDIDFVIRTGDNPDRECLSGFPIWNSSYAEFYHIKKNFPAVSPSDIENALDHYSQLRKKKGE